MLTHSAKIETGSEASGASVIVQCCFMGGGGGGGSDGEEKWRGVWWGCGVLHD